MQIKQLEYVREIARYGSITKAAEALYISQQALSESLRLLEKELDFPIFYRSKKGVEPTDEGKLFLNDLDNIFSTMASWSNYARSKKEKRNVKIIIQYILSELLLNEKLIAEVKAIPNLDVVWETMGAKEIVGAVRKDPNAIGIMLPQLGTPLHNEMLRMNEQDGWRVDNIAQNRRCILLRHDDVLTEKDELYLRDLYGREMVSNRTASATMSMQRLFRATGNDGYVLPESIDVLSFMLKNPNTVTTLPEAIAKHSPYIESGEIVIRHLADDTAEDWHCFLLCHETVCDTALVEILKKYFKES